MPGARLKRKTTIAVKVEAVEGVAESILAADAKYLVQDVKYKVEPRLIERLLNTTSFARKPPVIGQKLVRVSFRTEVVGSGVVDTEPAWAIFLKGCGFKPTVNAATSVEFDPVTLPTAYGAADGNVSLTIWVYEDGVVKKARGCRGTGKLTAEAGSLAYWDWEFLGIYDGVTDASYPALASGYDTNTPPLVESCTFAFQDMASGDVFTKMLEVDIGNTLVPRMDVTKTSGVKSILIADRAVIGSTDPEQMLEVDWGATDKGEIRRMADGVVGGLTLTIGSATGNKFTVSAPAAQVQITDVEGGDRDGIATNTVQFSFNVPLSEHATNKEVRFTTL